MENSQMPPGQPPVQNPNPAPQPPTPDVPGLPPGTFEYVDTSQKRNWKKIIELGVVAVIAIIPIVISFFVPDYSLTKSYAILNPASYVSGESYQTWGSIVTTAKKIIQPQTATNQETGQQPASGGQEVPTSTPVPTTQAGGDSSQPAQEAVYPTLSDDQTEFIIQIDQDQKEDSKNYSAHEQDPTPTKPYIFYPSSPPQSIQEPTATPTRTITPTRTPTPSPLTSSPYVACYGKKKGDNCMYQGSYNKKIEGKCRQTSGNYLICDDDYDH